jgi:putative transcriptional regulator
MSKLPSMPWPVRAVLAFAPVLVVLSVLCLAPQSLAQSPPSLAGQFLVASPDMGDPRFERTVILMMRHDRDGAFGVVVNRPVGEEPLSAILELLGEKDASITGQIRIHYGGPVQPEIAFVIHTTDYSDASTREVDGRVAMTSRRGIMRAIAGNTGPRKSIFAFGYAGWAPGQLEGEIARRGWVTVPADLALIFDEARDKVWDVAYARRTQDL